MSARRRRHTTCEPRVRGSVLSEYVVVLFGLAIAFTGVAVIVDLVVEHDSEFSAALAFPF